MVKNIKNEKYKQNLFIEKQFLKGHRKQRKKETELFKKLKDELDRVQVDEILQMGENINTQNLNRKEIEEIKHLTKGIV